MAFYIRRYPAHVTYYVEVIEAESREAAEANAGDGEYIGYIDGDWDASAPADEWGGPFETEDDATSSDEAWTEG